MKGGLALALESEGCLDGWQRETHTHNMLRCISLFRVTKIEFYLSDFT